MNKIILEEFYKSRPIRIYKIISPTIRAERFGLMILEYDNDKNKTSNQKRLD